MDILYHASGYRQEELMPGFRRSGKKVQWDKTESNAYLYATTDREEAISQAFASMMEKTFDVVRYQTGNDKIKATVRGKKMPTLAEIHEIRIYLYTIEYDPKDGWIKVNNKFNKLDTEYKTDHQIDTNIIKRDEIDLKEWLKTKQLSFALEAMPVCLDW
jgi:hypothetical protein